MTNDTKIELNRKLAIAVGILLVPVIAFVINNFKDSANVDPNIPTLTEQPVDTQVANKVLQVHYWQSPGGAKIYFVPTEHLPIIDLMVNFDAGSSRDGKLPGISRLATLATKEGTTKLEANEIAERFESSGAIFNVDNDIDKASFSLRALSTSNFSPLVELLANVVATPKYSPASVDRIKQQMLTMLAKEQQDPNRIAHKEYIKTIFENHPFALGAKISEDSINSIKNSDLSDFNKKYFVESNAIITIVGGLHRNKAKELANIILASLPKGNKPEPLPKAHMNNTEVVKRIYFPSKQTHIYIGEPGISQKDDESYALQIVNDILGGPTFNARLFAKVREELGLAYSIYSRISRLQENGHFYINMQTKAEKTEVALEEIHKVLHEFVETGPSDSEIELAKQHLIGGFPLKLASNSSIIREVSNAAFYNLPFDYFDSYVDKIRNLDNDYIRKVLREKLHPANMSLIIVGEQNL